MFDICNNLHIYCYKTFLWEDGIFMLNFAFYIYLFSLFHILLPTFGIKGIVDCVSFCKKLIFSVVGNSKN